MSVIGPEVKAKGVLSTQEPVEIQGEFRGELRSRSQLTVAPGGHVEAKVETPKVVIQGVLIGDVKAPRQLEIHSAGRFRGKLVMHPDVLILSPKADFGESPGGVD